jgi:hypothetical protein
MISNEQRFIWDIDDLREIIKNPEPRNLLAASAILRRLLTDSGEPLLHKVARERDFQPRFIVTGNAVDPALENAVFSNPNLILHARDPSAGQMDGSLPTRSLGLDDFLRERIFHIGQTPITIKELINYVANVGGGVHQGSPRKKGNAQIIHASTDRILINDQPYPLQSMANIGQITLNALLPLYLRIRS